MVENNRRTYVMPASGPTCLHKGRCVLNLHTYTDQHHIHSLKIIKQKSLKSCHLLQVKGVMMTKGDVLHVFLAHEEGIGSGDIAQLVKCLARMHRVFSVQPPAPYKPVVVAHACNPNTQEQEDHQFESSLNYVGL